MRASRVRAREVRRPPALLSWHASNYAPGDQFGVTECPRLKLPFRLEFRKLPLRATAPGLRREVVRVPDFLSPSPLRWKCVCRIFRLDVALSPPSRHRVL